MERLARYTLVGFHVKGCPVTDELLAPFAGHKSMVNFGVEDGALTDACFPCFLRYAQTALSFCWTATPPSTAAACPPCKAASWTFSPSTAPGWMMPVCSRAASIPKLSRIEIDHTAVTYEGLLAIAGNNRIEPVAHMQFTKEQMEHFSQLQREKAKNPVQLDKQAVEECRRVLSAFFAEMTEWEQYMEQAGFEDAGCAPPAGNLGKVCEPSPARAAASRASHTVPRVPTKGKNSLARSRSPRTSSASPEKKIPALTAASS